MSTTSKATVHFIWSGPFKEEISVKTPNEFAAKCKVYQIVFWCQEYAFEEFRKNLTGSNIQLRICSDVKAIVGELYHGQQKLYDEAQDILTYLHSVRAYSATKDLLSLIILHTFGGYYFDTTTLLPPDSDGSTLNSSLSKILTTPRVVGLPGTTKHQILLQTATSITEGADDLRVAKGIPFSQVVRSIDVWAMYFPMGDPSCEVMLLSYISRCNQMGLYPDGQPMNFAGLSGADVIQNKVSPGRDDFIGSLIARSAYDGLLIVACGGQGENISKFCWDGKKTDALNELAKKMGHIAVPELGINKYYAGSWRDQFTEEENKEPI